MHSWESYIDTYNGYRVIYEKKKHKTAHVLYRLWREWVLPYLAFTGTCRWTGYGFLVSLS